MKVEDYIASGILEQYVMGELPSNKEEEVLHYAERYPEVRRELLLIEESLELIAKSAAVTPSSHVLDKIQHKITEAAVDPQIKKNRKISFLQYGVAATFTLKLIFMAVAAHFWINWQHSENRLEQMQKRYDQLAQETRQVSQAFAIVSDPAYQTIVLQGNQEDAAGRPIMYWNETSKQGYINPNQLPANEEGEQYQLWAMVEDNPLSLGVFDVSSTAFPQLMPIEGVENIFSFVITLEPKGGSSKPDLQGVIYTGKTPE